MKRLVAFLMVLVCVAIATERASAYLKLGSRVGTRTVTLKWNTFPIRYFITNRAGGGVSAQALQSAAGRAFATWEAVPTATVSHQFAGFTANSPVLNDGITTIGFDSRPDQDRVLGATNFLIDTVTGEIVESDIYLNSIFDWSVGHRVRPTGSMWSRSRCTRSGTCTGWGIPRWVKPSFGPADVAYSEPRP